MNERNNDATGGGPGESGGQPGVHGLPVGPDDGVAAGVPAVRGRWRRLTFRQALAHVMLVLVVVVPFTYGKLTCINMPWQERKPGNFHDWMILYSWDRANVGAFSRDSWIFFQIAIRPKPWPTPPIRWIQQDFNRVRRIQDGNPPGARGKLLGP